MIFLSIVIVASITGGCALIISMQRQAALAAFQTGTTNLGIGMSRQTAYFLNQADQALKTIQMQVLAAHAPSPPVADAGMQSQEVFSLLSGQLARLSGVSALMLVDANGTVVNSAQGWPAKPVDVTGEDYFSHFKAHDDPALFAGIPARDPASGGWTVPIARRLDDAQGAVAPRRHGMPWWRGAAVFMTRRPISVRRR
jgi:hypothetical protein